MKEWYEIHIFDENTEKYEANGNNMWTILNYGRGTVDLLNVDEQTTLLHMSKWKLRTIDMKLIMLV